MRFRPGAVPSVIAILLLAALAFFAPTLIKVHPASLVPHLAMGSTNQKESSPTNLLHQVWVNPRSGIFYCRESKFYGKIKPGFSMVQGLALQKGYRPADETPCI